MTAASDEPVVFRRLLPEPGRLTAAQATEELRLGDRAPRERPYVALNMVATADGRATIAGRAGPIGNRADRELFHQLRARADAVMAGAGTARVERYRRLVRDPALRAQRERDGLAPDPVACLVTRSLDLPVEEVPLLDDPDATVLVLTSSEAELPRTAARVEYLRSPGPAPDLRTLFGRLLSEHGIRSILCEGGPTLNASLLPLGLVDELFLSLAPKLAGGLDPLTIVAGPALAAPVELDLISALECEGHLFLRYAVRAPEPPRDEGR